MKKSELVSYRLPLPGDIPFFFATWLKGLRFGNEAAKARPSREYYTAQHRLIEAVLRRSGVIVSVACLKDDSDVILGYSVTQGSTVHWVFVKKQWRGIGIGHDLLPLTIATVTATTKGIEAKLKNFPLIKVTTLEENLK
jgi:GNAT superfamily N-acetyltransferase